ncbi:glutamine-synthetase adenylyltransferase [Tateyamaria sp. SN6-1]|uniref:[protein-PII] uridylyltransferase family protein n=1 Tax=Tateyamaria sp. SN6-1 TaxID=3092148 RepID=UPI0039F45068
MSLMSSLTRMPRPHQPDRGRDVAAAVAVTDPVARDLIAGAAGCSPYLASLIEKETAWLPGALEAPETALADALCAPSDVPLKPALRQAKRRVALLTALADLGGAWSLEQVTGALTDLGDMACEVALAEGLALQRKRGKLPDGEVGLFVLAMGKMGAAELNYSSDIDLICLFDETRHEPADYATIRSACVKAVQHMCGTLSDLTEDGYVFRTDLRLRPDPSVTPVVISTGAAERYYESVGRTWERAAYIKARVCAGDIAAGETFLKELRPFVWRRHLDFAAVQDAHDMRLAIRAHKGTGGPITLPGHNMKLGRGGIREIEFFTQTRQLIAGGRDPDLRVRGTVEGLEHLARKGWVTGGQAARLSDHYRFARTVEHRVQMVQDAQTHALPRNDEGFDRLAAMMDMDRDTLCQTLRARLSEVHSETEGFFAPGARAEAPPAAIDPGIQARWRNYPALRSERGAALFDRIEPMLLARLNEAARPHEALLAFDGFLAGLPAGVQLFSLFEANPSLVDLLVDIVGTSPALAQYLSRNAQVLDAVLGGAFFEPWPGQVALQSDAAKTLDAVPDYEGKLDAIRVWAREWHFRVGVHMLRALVTPQEASRQYADLAQACVAALWPEVVAQFALRHGSPPGRGAVVVAMGSLGAGTLSAQSDLDLIVVYDAAGVEASDGKRPLPARTYYARLTQAMITAITAQTARGRLYEADMRLRPSGNQGPVATSWSSYAHYQRNEAWLWEHLALTRARVVAGADSLGDDIEALRCEVLRLPRETNAVLAELSDMRARIAAAKPPGTVWDIKVGPGRLQDIELLSQVGAVLTGTADRTPAAGLAAAVEARILGAAEAESLTRAHTLFAAVQMATRLLSTGAIVAEDVGTGGQAILLRVTQAKDMAAAEACLADEYAQAARIIDRVLGDAGQQGAG